MTNLEYMICEAERCGEIDLYTRDILLDVYTESAISPIKGFLNKIKHIKDAKPKEYDGPKDVKKFVDNNYDDLMKVSKILEKEPENMRKSDIKFIAGFTVSLIGSIALVEASPIVGLVVYVISIISCIVASIIKYIRTSDDIKASNDLSKIHSSLKRINLNKLDNKTKNKVVDIIESIEDVETELGTRMKITKESVDVDDIRKEIYERELIGEISVEEREELLNYLDSQLVED